MKVVTWNISGRAEPASEVSGFLERCAPDTLFLQGTEVNLLEADIFIPQGYEVHFGEGDEESSLALISRIPVTSRVPVQISSLPGITRHVAGFKLASIQFYHVNCPEPLKVRGPDFQRKLDFVEAFAGWLSGAHSPEERVVLLGNWSIAPLPDDVECPESMGDCVGYHPLEHKAWAKLLSSGFYDGVKPHVLSRTFSGWKDGAAGSGTLAMRSEHILVTGSLEEATSNARIYEEMRRSDAASHVPVEITVEPDALMEEGSFWSGF